MQSFSRDIRTKLAADDLQEDLVGQEASESNKAGEEGEGDGHQAGVEIGPEAGLQ